MMGSGSGRRFIRYQLPAILWALLIFVSSSIPGRDFPHVNIPHLDKVVHFAYYLVFALLLARAFESQSLLPDLARFSFVLSFVLSIAYGVTDELHQLFVPERTSDPKDLMADAAGALVGIVILEILRWRARRQKEVRSRG